MARSARTALLRAFGPIERVLRRPGKRELPPLWLRRHAGPVEKFSRSAAESMSLIRALSLVGTNSLVLDLGCGPGAMAVELQTELGPNGAYVGVDVHAASIRWCRGRFGGDGRFRFELAPIDTPYSRGAPGNACEFRFPVEDGSCDFVVAKSLFTHLLEPEAGSYLREIGRALSPSGRAMVTVFAFDPRLRTPAFPFGTESSSIRWKVQNRPQAAVAYSRTDFEDLISQAGLRIERRIDGFYPGTSRIPAGQDTYILGRGPAPDTAASGT
ncbi:MAG: class I SAM-dependent methyltransferase [Thermoanaerobaculia bacterium]